MKWILMIVVLSAAMFSMTGCEWKAAGDEYTWNDSYNSVNFSGVYRGYNGGILVTDYTATPGTPGVTNNVSQSVGVGIGAGQTVYSGLLNTTPVLSGSLNIIGGGYVFTDNGDGSLSGNVAGTAGSIDYGTGSWSIDLNGGTINSGVGINATYQTSVAGTAGTGSAGAGTSGITIYTFTVFHEGQNVTITDNNGSVYSGGFGSIRSTSGSTTLTIGDTVIGQFTAEGTSAAGIAVKIVGTFQGVTGSSTVSDRRMLGTWIEDGGTTGDVNGEASPISLSTTTS